MKFLFKNPTQTSTLLMNGKNAVFIFLIATFINLGALINTVFLIVIFVTTVIPIILLLSSSKLKISN